MSELALVSLLAAVIGSVLTYFATLRRVNADVHIARVTLEDAGENDDRQALRDFQNQTIIRREAELLECRQKLEIAEATKYQYGDTLDEAIQIIKSYKEVYDTSRDGRQL
jgi:hypothetical protein